MILTVLSILTLAILFTGVGLHFPARLYRNEPGLDTLLETFWIGWAMSIGFLQLWHLVLPVQAAAFIILFLISISGWLSSWSSVQEHVITWKPRQALLLAAAGMVPALILANHVMFVPYTSKVDHGLYHMQSVEWASRYAIVPGLGNLHHRLAFNNSNFLYAAVLDWGILDGRSYYVAGTLLTYVLALTCAAGFYRLFHAVTLSRLYWALMIPVLVENAGSNSLAGYSPDVPVFMLNIVLGGALIRLYESAWDLSNYRRRALYITFLAAAGVTVKLSFAAFGFLTILAVMILGIIRFPLPLRQHLRHWLAWASAGILLVVPWLARGVVLSGYLLFPNASLPLPVPWKMPAAFVEPIQPIITLWARTASANIEYTADLEWFLAWLNQTPFIVRQAFVFTLVIAAVDILLLVVLRHRAAQPHWGAAMLFGISALSLVYWFVLGPSYRFSGGIFWTLLVSAVLFGFRLLASGEMVQHPLRLACALVLILSLWLSPNHFSNNLSRRLLLAPPPEQTLAEAFHSQQTFQTRQTRSGLTVYLAPESLCLHAPLPCTPAPDFLESLALFDPDHLQRGFFVQQEAGNP